jgi:hypothetical protein
MSHPSSCQDPDCTLSFREHLLSIGIAAAAMPTRAVHRTPGQVDEPAWRTQAREDRWAKDMPAFKRLHDAGQTPDHIDGSAALEQSLGG